VRRGGGDDLRAQFIGEHRDGLLVRTVYPTVPPKVEYRLTPIAQELGDSFAALNAWAETTPRHRRGPRRYGGRLPAAIRDT
jgi:DNA-binding HxlR family transcriptional regulator